MPIVQPRMTPSPSSPSSPSLHPSLKDPPSRCLCAHCQTRGPRACPKKPAAIGTQRTAWRCAQDGSRGSTFHQASAVHLGHEPRLLHIAAVPTPDPVREMFPSSSHCVLFTFTCSLCTKAFAVPLRLHSTVRLPALLAFIFMVDTSGPNFTKHFLIISRNLQLLCASAISRYPSLEIIDGFWQMHCRPASVAFINTLSTPTRPLVEYQTGINKKSTQTKEQIVTWFVLLNHQRNLFVMSCINKMRNSRH